MKILEISKKFNIPTDTLRYYERVGVLLSIKLDANGERNYTKKDCKAIEFIKSMTEAGVCLDSLIDYMELFCEGACTKKARKDIIHEETGKLKKRIKTIENAAEKLEE